MSMFFKCDFFFLDDHSIVVITENENMLKIWIANKKTALLKVKY